MYISRLQVEDEGFLGGLDITFQPGLNVIIGARGTGKTSIVELIRYCLGAGGFTEDAVTKGTQQAREILQGGAVTVQMNGAQGPIFFTRSSTGHLTSSTDDDPRCTVLAQNEVEAVGAQASGRMQLIDRYRDKRHQNQSKIASATLELSSLTSQIRTVLAEGSNLTQQVSAAQGVRQELEEARAAQEQLLAQAQASEADRENLARLEEGSNSLSARQAVVADNLEQVDNLSRQVASLLDMLWIPLQGDSDLEDLEFAEARRLVTSALGHLQGALSDLTGARGSLTDVSLTNEDRRQRLDDQSRQLRQRLDLVQSGIGVASRRVQELEERLGQLNALTRRLDERRSRFLEISRRRDAAYERLDSIREDIFNERLAVAERITNTLGPQIRSTVFRSARIAAYEAAIISALRGTGIHYNTLAPQIARALSPFEFVKWAEEGNYKELASSLGITPDRAIAIVTVLREGGTDGIIACEIEDEVVLELLDGHDYKRTDRLSIGQRCTVILPVLLGQHGDPLLVDQPEDHLDNAFVANTLVAALNRRSSEDQFIFTSHNANIPVLGEADQVIVMDSDGDRAYVSVAGSLNDPAVVGAINRIMEGGEDAFARRSAFYEQGRRS